MKTSLISALIAFTLTPALTAFAKDGDHPHGDRGACRQVEEVCEKAGFIKGQAKEGNGLWVDCIRPIMQGKPAPAKAVRPLPSVSADVVQACKSKHPSFGEKVGHQEKK